MKLPNPMKKDWADREAERLIDLKASPNQIVFEIATSLRQAAHNHLMFDAVAGKK